jgi:uncharacterized protein
MSVEGKPRIQKYTWADVITLSEKLGSQVAERSQIDVIIGVLRGGAFPALMLSHMLGVGRMYGVRVSTRGNGTPRTYRNAPVVEGVEGLPLMTERTVLVVDDVTNTGNTLRAVRSRVASVSRPASIITASLVWDTVADDDSTFVTRCMADCFVDSVHAWVDFPWEYDRIMRPLCSI